MTQPWIADRAVWARLAIMLVLVGYLAVIVASYVVLLPLFLEGPLVLVGWLFLPGLYVWARLRHIDTRPRPLSQWRSMFRPLALTVTFGAVVAVALFLAMAWDVPSRCHVSINCVKGYEWRIDNGKYYHAIEGLSAEIGQQAYLQETGTFLRSAATFGLYAMCLAWFASAGLRPRSTGPPT
jgi:hypothetical protein